MSHVCSISVDITDLSCLEQAAKDLGLVFSAKRTYRWYGQSVNGEIPEGFTEADLGKCEYNISVPNEPNAYEVGVVKNRVGRGYSLHFDFWENGFGLIERIGEGASKLKQRYSTNVAKKAAIRAGFRVSEHVGTDGKVILKARR